MSSKPTRLTAIISEDIRQNVEDFRFSHRYSTLTEAVNHLICVGLDVEKRKQEAA